MVIIGAGGFAKEVFHVVAQQVDEADIVFYDDTPTAPQQVFDKYTVLHSETELLNYFDATADYSFILGLGDPILRARLYYKLKTLGGQIRSVIDRSAVIGQYTDIGIGANILGNACISNTCSIGLAPLIYYHAVITHDCTLGDFVELSPGATLLGHVHVGDHTQIGANATVLPTVKIGKNCIIGAGTVVTKDIPDDTVAAGIPARILRANDRA